MAEAEEDWSDEDWGDDGEDWGEDISQIEIDPMKPQISGVEVQQYVKENPLFDLYWECGRCKGPKNHPSRAICMCCGAPNMDNVMNIIIAGKSRECPKCKIQVADDLYSFHIEWCQPLKSDEDFSNWAVDLPEVCKSAIVCVHEKGKTSRDKDIAKIEATMKRIGYSHLGVETILGFFEWHVPVIIQIFPNELVEWGFHDPFYRNQFETGKSHGSTNLVSRKSWETRMFNKIYDAAKAEERVKYGCLNMSMDSKGCSAAYSYGDAYFRLNDATVRWRVTITSQDSSHADATSGTLKYSTPILSLLPDAELRALCECVEVFRGNKQENQKQAFHYSVYREAQIHGPISLQRDVDEFHVPKAKYKTIEEKIQLLCTMYNIKLIWF